MRAKEEFFWKFGKVFHDDPFYDGRMSYFLDYFLLERPISTLPSSRTPMQLYQDEVLAREVTSDPFKRFGIKGFVHGLFQITKTRDLELCVIDLVTDKKIVINARHNESFKYLKRKEIFQGFLYCTDEQVLLSRGNLFHPAKITRILYKLVKKSKKRDDYDPQADLAKLARQHLKHLRHSHVDPRRIYGEILV